MTSIFSYTMIHHIYIHYYLISGVGHCWKRINLANQANQANQAIIIPLFMLIPNFRENPKYKKCNFS